MKFKEFQKKFGDMVCFGLQDIQNVDNNFYRRRLYERQKKNHIIKIINGKYIFSDLELSDSRLFFIANNIYRPSYVSLETALSYYHIIPEGVITITSISSKKTKKFNTKIGTFEYRSLKPDLFFGYEKILVGKNSFLLADLEKTLIDFFYLNPKTNNDKDWKGMRFDTSLLKETLSIKKIQKYAKYINSPKLSKTINNFIYFIQNNA